MAIPAAGTVHVIDDDISVLQSVTRLLQIEGLATQPWSSAAEFLAAQYVIAFPACVVLDVKMPGMDGFALQEELEKRGRPFPIVFLTAHAEVPSTVRAMKAGAVDFLLKPYVPEQLIAVVRAALGRSAATLREARGLEELRERHAALTPREREVLGLVVRGLLNKEVGTRLGIAEKTIKVHRANVMKKMGAGSLAGLVQQAVVLGLISPTAARPLPDDVPGPMDR